MASQFNPINPIAPASMHEALLGGALVITSNQRLARKTSEDYARWQNERGVTVWASAAIHSLSGWLQRCGDELERNAALDAEQRPRLLSNGQAALLWQQVVAARVQNPLLNIEGVAGNAQEAWHLRHEWQLDIDVDDCFSMEARAWLTWCDDYRDRLLSERWIDIEQLQDDVIEAIRADRLRLPKQLILVGFAELTPRQQRLLSVCREQGTVIHQPERPGALATVERYAFDHPQAELRAAAIWARQSLTESPERRIAIVVPDLAVRRDEVFRELGSVLQPDSLCADEVGPAGFNVSMGRRLLDHGPVRDLLALLSVLHGVWSCAEVSRLLRSPWVTGHASEWVNRAQLDRRLRDDNALRVTPKALIEHAEQHACPLLAASLRALLTRSESVSGRQSHRAWIGIITGMADDAGWLAADDGQLWSLKQAVHDALTEFSHLDTVSPLLARDEVIARLRAVLAERTFQPPTPPFALQVLGLLEADGQVFDAIWLLGLDDRTMPTPSRPNPLLPAHMQRAAGLPRASVERERRYAKGLLNRFMSNTAALVCSHARFVDDAPQRPSALIADWPELPFEFTDLPTQQTPALETIPDSVAPPITGGHRGGSRLLADQSACPFRAVARHRLAAEPLAEPEAGLGPDVRGQLVHDALDSLWGELRRFDALWAMNPDQQASCAAKHADLAVNRAKHKHAQVVSAAEWALEAQRLTRLLAEWLGVETQRDGFEVHEHERVHVWRAGDLRLRTRVDRIDRLPSGELAVIDYKTGKPNPNRWFGDRLEDPQLPMYAVDQDDVAVVAFAAVRPGECRFHGATAASDLLPGLKAHVQTRAAAVEGFADWPETLATWRRQLHVLAEEFVNGRADVAPLNAKTCDHCGLQTLCRVGALESTVDDEVADDR